MIEEHSMLLEKIPNSPGCYLMKNINGTIIYIGKAKNLKKRVSSYFSKESSDSNDQKTSLLVKEIASIDFIATTNEKEALLLESNLIKKNQPKYNIDLKDSKRYSYIKITNDNLPKMLVARKIVDDATYIGPFTSGVAREEAMRLARRLFGIRQVKKESSNINKKAKKQTLKEIQKYSPLFSFKTEQDYVNAVDKTKLFLLKKTDQLIVLLEEEMNMHAKNKNFEAAKSLRDKIYAVKGLSERQNVESKKQFDSDVIAFAQNQTKTLIEIFHIKKGMLTEKEDYEFSKKEFNFLDFPQFLIRFYETHPIPSEIIIEKDFEELDSIAEFFREKEMRKIDLIVPKKGEKFELINLVKKNAELHLDKKNEELLEIQKVLRLKTIPKTIECFDVSNISGTNATGSMVQFLNAEPNKSEYRRFKISAQKQDSPNDFEMIQEIVFRRYTRQKKLNQLPDLIIIDGGKGQLKYAKSALKELELNIPIVGLAKKEETIIFPSNFSVKLDLKTKGAKLIQRIRNEAHRFAVKYHRHLRENIKSAH